MEKLDDLYNKNKEKIDALNEEIKDTMIYMIKKNLNLMN